MKITWRPLPGGRAQAPYAEDGERLPFTVCSYGDGVGKRYEAWDKRGAWASLLATRLKSPDEAKARVRAEIERAGP